MGGNALKNCYTRRFDSDEYFSLYKKFKNKFCFMKNVERYDLIPTYKNKKTFGDMDIIYTTSDDTPLDIKFIKTLFVNSNEVSHNSDIISFEYNEIQIDLIHSKKCYYDYALNYFKYSDLGNLTGRIAHKFGLKHGHRGLTLPLRDGDNLFDEIVLTYDYNRALTFLGFDSNHFNNGFDSINQIYNYVITNKYFNPEIYKLENLNTIARTRDKKRPTYNGFLEFCSHIDSTKCYQYSIDKTVYLSKIFSYFPECQQQFDDIMAKLAMQKLAKEKFNGLIVSHYTGLNDKLLGQFMKYLKTKREFGQSFICYLTDVQIEKNIMKNFEDFKNEQI